MSDEHAEAADHAATLRAWRERGADKADPVRFGFIEGLARRAAAQSGAARELLDGKIAGLMASYEEAVAARLPEGSHTPVDAPAAAPVPVHAHAPVAPAPTRATAPSRAPARAPASAPTRTTASAPALTPARTHTPAPARPAAPRGPLGTLADLINQRPYTPAANTATAAPTATSSNATTFPPELKALDDVRNTWARLDAEQRLEQALAQVPANPGPLNSYHLVLRTLTLMRDASPEYLQRFMAYVDALMWLERSAP